MSYEFKIKGYGNASHLPMRVQSDKNGYWGQTSRGRGHFPYKVE